MADFSVGDMVQLKSGGPIMTVTQIDGNEVWCQWFDDKKPEEMKFIARVPDLRPSRMPVRVHEHVWMVAFEGMEPVEPSQLTRVVLGEVDVVGALVGPQVVERHDVDHMLSVPLVRE